jgi:hypothetical protein
MPAFGVRWLRRPRHHQGAGDVKIWRNIRSSSGASGYLLTQAWTNQPISETKKLEARGDAALLPPARTSLATAPQARNAAVDWRDRLAQKHVPSCNLACKWMPDRCAPCCWVPRPWTRVSTVATFAWLISHQPAVLFSQNKLAIINQRTVFFSQNKPASVISNQPNEHAGVQTGPSGEARVPPRPGRWATSAPPRRQKLSSARYLAAGSSGCGAHLWGTPRRCRGRDMRVCATQVWPAVLGVELVNDWFSASSHRWAVGTWSFWGRAGLVIVVHHYIHLLEENIMPLLA